MRVLLTTDNYLSREFDFYGKNAKFEALESIAGKHPVVFIGSFQKPSLYHFFTKKKTTVLSAITSRQTQFDILQQELAYQEQSVFVCSKIPGLSKKFTVGAYSFDGFFIENFQSVNRLKITFELNQTTYSKGDTLILDFEIFNPQSNEINFKHSELPVTLVAVYFNKDAMFFSKCEWISSVEKLPSLATIKGGLKTVIPDLQGNYKFGLTLDNKICKPINSRFVKIKINH